MSGPDSASAAPPARLLPALFHPWVWRMAWRDARAQKHRLLIFALAIVSGVTALTSIHSIKVSVEKGVGAQAKSLLGADLLISSRQALPEKTIRQISSQAVRLSREITFSSMLSIPSANAGRLVQLRGIDGLYPFYGTVESRPAEAWKDLQRKPGILLEATLLDQFNLKIGDIVRVGERDLPVLGVIIKPAPRSSRFSGLAPEAYLNLDELKSTGLLGLSSLGFYNLYLKTTDQELIKTIRKTYAGEGWRFETPEDRKDSLGKTLDVFQQFLGIIAMVSLLLGAIGVASAVGIHLDARISTVAVLRCLGCPGQSAYAVYLIQSLCLSVLGALGGAGLGILLHIALLFFFRNQLPIQLDISPEWGTAALATAIGFAVCAAFTFLPLSRVTSISPGRALNPIQEEKTASRKGSHVAVGLFLLVMLLLLALFNIPNPARAAGMVAGLAFTLAALWAVARLLIFLARRIIRPSWPYLLRQGLSNLHRPRNQTLLFLFSLGLGSFLLLLILLTHHAALQKITIAGVTDSPNVYLVDVQASQLAGVTNLVQQLNLPVLETAAIVTMRIQSVKGIPVRELQEQGKIPRWILQREFRSSYRTDLNKSESIVAGRWINQVEDPNAPVPLSLETDMAKDLSLQLNDELVLDVQGLSIRARVASLRKVDWSRFNLNFFMLFPPSVLENAPGFHIVTTRIPENASSGILQRDIARDFPNVSAIDLTLVLETVRDILDQVSVVIQFVVGFTLLSGLAILAGTLLNGRDQRLRESSLLRTLGASSRQIRLILLTEYAALGFFSGLAGALLAILAYIPLSIWVFESDPWPGIILPLAVIGGATLLSILAGLVLSRGVCTHPPLEILRST